MPRRVQRGQLPCLLLTFVVLLLGMSALMPVAEAPNWSERTWDICWNTNNVYPDDDDPAWTRTTTGTVSRSFVYHNQILNLSLTDASADNEKYSISFSATEYAYAEARVNIPLSGTALVLRFDETTDTFYTFLTILPTYIELTYIDLQTETSNTIKHYEENIIGSNHTYGLLYYADAVESYYAVYYDGNLAIWLPSQTYTMEIDEFYFSTQDAPPSASGRYAEWDYVALDLTDAGTKVRQLQSDIAELERELAQLRKRLGDSLPETYVNQTNLPVIPRDTRGTLEYDTVFVDPYLVTVYDLLTFKTGSNLPFYLIYPSSSDEVTVIEDWIHIEETSYTRLWINDTVGASELLNTTDAVGPLNLEYGYNITVQTSGASSSVRADRTSTVRLISAFNWGESTQTGIFATTSKIENDLGFEDMSNVLIRWAFPIEDSENRAVHIDMQSVTVWDADNNLELDRGRHYSLDESSVIMELRWLNVSESRSFRIEFTRELFVETEEYFVVRDNSISISDTYQNAPFTTNIHFTASGRAFFEGKIIIRFDLSGRYSGEHLDVRSLIIKRSDTSLAQQYTYDSISNELRITDQTVGAGESITYTLYWDWYDEKSAVYELILGDPLILYSLLLLAGVAGVLHIVMATKEEKRKRLVGFIIIAADAAILVIVLLAG